MSRWKLILTITLATLCITYVMYAVSINFYKYRKFFHDNCDIRIPYTQMSPACAYAYSQGVISEEVKYNIILKTQNDQTL